METHSMAKSEYDAWMAAGRKLKKGASAADAGVTSAMVKTYGEIAGRYTLELQVGISRLPYEPRNQGTNMLQGGLFANNQWSLRLELQSAQLAIHSIWAHEMAYTNATGYWLGLQQTSYSMIDELLAESLTEAALDAKKTKVSLLGAWARILGEFGLRVLAIRCEFYRNSITDPVSARVNQHIYEEDNHLPYNESMDDRSKQIETLRETQLMKAFAAISARNAVERAGGSSGATD
jgi:hypothetical protein